MIWRRYRLTITEPGCITTEVETMQPHVIENYLRHYLRRCERIQIDLVQTAMSTEDCRAGWPGTGGNDAW